MICKMKDSYIILPRTVVDDDYFSQKFTRAQAFIDLFFLAAYKERTFYIRGNKVTVKRGQVSASKALLADRWKWSRNTVQKYLDELQAVGKIEQHKSNIVTIISLKNYEMNEKFDNELIKLYLKGKKYGKE